MGCNNIPYVSCKKVVRTYRIFIRNAICHNHIFMCYYLIIIICFIICIIFPIQGKLEHIVSSVSMRYVVPFLCNVISCTSNNIPYGLLSRGS